ncbi:hypothetical protein CHARACLAT_029663 [Characodon lateralis]|uniref:Uncharacterized protein n=1 Tax=Characodon lateralis TaxID=208331 RepID=A0ABU7ENM5_9TELE|nr:hypothetical protein [Characodon lateralis]
MLGTKMVEYLHEAKASRPYPYILTLENDQHASQAFVIIVGQAFVCFKAFFILDIKYPKQCERVGIPA